MLRCVTSAVKESSLCKMLSYVLGSVFLLAGLANAVNQTCPDYTTYSQQYHAPFSSGRYNLSYMRPSPGCRTFVIPAVDNTIAQYKNVIKDPDLYRLFQNAYPNTLDTTIKWKGVAANNSAEELTFVITGDINVRLRFPPS